MIIENGETLIDGSQVCERHGIHQGTYSKWGNRGIRGVKLETVLVGNRRMTSWEAVGRFLIAATAAANGMPPAGAPIAQGRTQQQTAKAVRKAVDELAAAGA